MPAALNEIGVKCVTAALVESVDVQKQLEHKIIKKSDGALAAMNLLSAVGPGKSH